MAHRPTGGDHGERSDFGPGSDDPQGPGPSSGHHPSPEELAADIAWGHVETLSHVLTQARTQVLRHLVRGPMRVKDLAAELELDANSVTYHLAPLRKLGLLEYDSRGCNRVYRLSRKVKLVREAGQVLLGLELARDCGIVVRIGDTASDLSPRPDPPATPIPPAPNVVIEEQALTPVIHPDAGHDGHLARKLVRPDPKIQEPKPLNPPGGGSAPRGRAR